MKFQQYLNEKFWDAMENRWGKTEKSPTGYNDIFINATNKEIGEMVDKKGDNEFEVVLIDNKRALCFGRHILHDDVIDYFDVNRANAITLHVIFTGGPRSVRLEATVTMKHSIWARRKTEEEFEEYVRNHEYLKKFKIVDVDMRY